MVSGPAGRPARPDAQARRSASEPRAPRESGIRRRPEANVNPVIPAAAPEKIPHSISREDMAKLPIRRYEGRICLVATPADLEEARADLEQESIAGFDTETRPAFKKGESHLPALVQVATARAVYLFQLRRAEVHPLLAALLSEARTVKAGISLKDDRRVPKAAVAFEEENSADPG